MTVVTGAQHEVGVDEMFFSTTDKKGVIEQANAVFVRLSRYSREQLVGAPHNIIRHPDMPGGAFRVMWDTLEAGRPFGAYVHNLAADGSRYDVFATITPVADGYLSVRTRPCRTDIMAVADSLYDSARDLERQLEAEGKHAPARAREAAEHLAAALQSAGVGTYDDFLMEVLPAEVEARHRISGGIPLRREAPSELVTILATSHELFDHLEAWLSDLDRLAQFSLDLQEAAHRLAKGVSNAARTAQLIQDVEVGPEFASLIMPLRLWSDMAHEIDPILAEIGPTLEELRSSTAATRFRIALARLHTEITARFAVELIDSQQDADKSREPLQNLPSIGLLCQALSEGIDELKRQVASHADLVHRAMDLVDESAGVMQIPTDLMATWHASLAARSDVPPRIAQLSPQIGAQVTSSAEAIAALQHLGVQADQALIRHDSGILADCVERIAKAADSVLASRGLSH
ncbi:MAG: PAS domain-containing protein [Propionibacteriaceae bacterium]|nr:PAS domain-containing protein [Propionibacteriaceae bacterium]